MITADELSAIAAELTRATRHIEETLGVKVKLVATQIHALRDTTVPEQLMSIVAETMGLPYSGFTDRSRAGELVEMRTIAVAMIDAFTTTRTGEIGRLLGNRDHATIANMRQNIRDRIAASDEVFMAHYAACQKAITKWFDSQKNRKDEN